MPPRSHSPVGQGFSPAFAALLCLAAIALSSPATAQVQLPEGAGRAETVKVCGTCHPAERGASVRLTREGWEEVIAKMVALGARGTDDELAAILGYLATHFEGDSPAPLNLNRATSVELESIAGFLRRESATWISHRAKRPCAALDDLRTVPGVNFAKIEKRRDRLVCF